MVYFVIICFMLFMVLGQKNICALAVINKLPRILVANADGYLYIYNLDPADGQECPLLRKHP